MAIVDESVFALAEQDPGFARLYFMLENELLQPKYDLHGYTLSDLMGSGIPESDPTLLRAVAGAAQASLSAAAPQAAAFALQVNSHQDALRKASELQNGFFKSLGLGVAGLFILIPLVVLGLNGYTLQRQKVLGRSLLLALGLVGLGFVLVMIWPLGSSYDYATTPGERILAILQALSGNGAAALGILALVSLASTLAASIYAISRHDSALGWSLILVGGSGGLIFLLIYASNRSQFTPPDGLLFAMLAGFFLLPVAFLGRSAGFIFQKQGKMALVLLSLCLLPLFLVGLVVLAGPAIGKTFTNVNMPLGGIEEQALMRDLKGNAPAVPAAFFPPRPQVEQAIPPANPAPVRLRRPSRPACASTSPRRCCGCPMRLPMRRAS